MVIKRTNTAQLTLYAKIRAMESILEARFAHILQKLTSVHFFSLF